MTSHLCSVFCAFMAGYFRAHAGMPMNTGTPSLWYTIAYPMRGSSGGSRAPRPEKADGRRGRRPSRGVLQNRAPVVAPHSINNQKSTISNQQFPCSTCLVLASPGWEVCATCFFLAFSAFYPDIRNLVSCHPPTRLLDYAVKGFLHLTCRKREKSPSVEAISHPCSAANAAK